MNVALVVAGGSGKRTGQDVPKQFLNVYDVPIFIYTLHNIELNDCIDEIVIVGPAGWENYIFSYAKQFGIKKLKTVITGGDTRFHSIFNGLTYLKEHDYAADTTVVIIDANRPLIPHRVIKESVDMLDSCDCTCAAVPCYDSIFSSQDGINLDKIENRSVLFAEQSPETVRLESVLKLYGQAEKESLFDLPTAALFVYYQKSVKAVVGSRKSMKITTVEDFELFKALLGETRISCLKNCE